MSTHATDVARAGSSAAVVWLRRPVVPAPCRRRLMTTPFTAPRHVIIRLSSGIYGPNGWRQLGTLDPLRNRNFSFGLVLFALIFCALAQANTTTRAVAAVSWSAQSWRDYQIIIWQDQTPERLAGLARLGITAGRIIGTRKGLFDTTQLSKQTTPFLALRLRWYIENIATDFYAAYHRWHPNLPVNWLFDEAKRLHNQDPTNINAFLRTPSLSDPGWLRSIGLRLRRHVRAYAPHHPLFYSLADEAGIADLTAAWDFDFAPVSLAAMRVWLKQCYHTLPALNREWGTRFPDWHAVLPMTTDEALKQSDENFAAWADFKEWMDIAFARSVRAGTEAVHAADPQALTALEGAQPPGWGGYNYIHLATTTDVIEISDEGKSVEIARSLAPNLITLTTSSLADPQQIHSVWHALLSGGRGLILWDADNAFVQDDGTPTMRGRTLGSLATEFRSGLAAQLMASTPEIDSVAILYSPASQRTQWLLDRKSDGKPWVARSSETEYLDHNAVRAAWQRAAGTLTHLGVQPRWLTRQMIERGMLQTAHIRVLVLPHAIALSPSEAKQIRAFAMTGGVVLADSEPGLFDAHSRRLARPLLADLTGAGDPIVLMPELRQEPQPDDLRSLVQLKDILEKARSMPRFSLSTRDGELVGNTDTRVFRNGDTTIIGLQRDWTNDGNGTLQEIIIDFKEPVFVYDLRHVHPVQHAAQIALALDAIAPSLIAISRTPLPALTVHGPIEAQLGTVAEFTIVPGEITPVGDRIVHVEVTAAGGTIMRAYTTNLAVPGGGATFRVPLAPTDATGTWTIEIGDVLDGRTVHRELKVFGSVGTIPERK
jgi:hypothetical protein